MPTKLTPLLLLWLLLPAMPLHAEAFTLEGLMRGLAAARHPTRHFTESRNSELLVAPISLHGTLAYVDGRLIKDIRQPFRERFSVEGDRLLIEREGEAEPQQIILSDYPPLFTFVTVFRASLEGDLKTLQQHYQTDLGGNANRWQLELRPRDARVAVHLKRIEIEGTQDDISRFTIEEQSGDSSILQLGERTE